MRRLCAALVLVAIGVAPLHADLTYVTRLTARPSAVSLPPPANPMLTMLGGVMISTLVPIGGLRITTTVSERGTRMEYDQAYLTVPAGSAMIVRPDGTTVVIDPRAKTYWKMTKVVGGLMGGALPVDLQLKAAGDTATIAGVPTTHSTLAVRVPFPLAEEGGLPGMPRELTASGDVWWADQYARYAKMTPAMANGLAAAIGLDALFTNGFAMRVVLRSELFAGQEIETVVTSIGELTAPASLFEIPDGYTEVPQPAMPGIGVGR